MKKLMTLISLLGILTQVHSQDSAGDRLIILNCNDSNAYYNTFQQYFARKAEEEINNAKVHLNLHYLCKEHGLNVAAEEWYNTCNNDIQRSSSYIDSAVRYYNLKHHWMDCRHPKRTWMEPLSPRYDYKIPTTITPADSNGYNFLTPKPKLHEITYRRNAIITYIVRTKVTYKGLDRVRRVRI